MAQGTRKLDARDMPALTAALLRALAAAQRLSGDLDLKLAPEKHDLALARAVLVAADAHAEGLEKARERLLAQQVAALPVLVETLKRFRNEDWDKPPPALVRALAAVIEREAGRTLTNAAVARLFGGRRGREAVTSDLLRARGPREVARILLGELAGVVEATMRAKKGRGPDAAPARRVAAQHRADQLAAARFAVRALGVPDECVEALVAQLERAAIDGAVLAGPAPSAKPPRKSGRGLRRT